MAEAPDPDIRERTFLYSVRAVRMYEYICNQGKSASGDSRRTVLRCDDARRGGGRGAARRIARGVRRQMAEAAKEAREGLYWLRLMKDTDTVPSKRIVPFELDTREIIGLLNDTGPPARPRRRPGAAGKAISVNG